MYCALIKQALSITSKLIYKAKKLNIDELLDFFARHRTTFLPQLRISKDESTEVKKLIVIGYDRVIIDFLLSNGIKFKITDISVEEIEFGSSIGGSVFVAGATNVVKNSKNYDLAKIYLILSLFVFNSKNTDLNYQDIKILRQSLMDIAKIKPPRVNILENDAFYPVRTSIGSHLEQAIKVAIGIIFAFFIFKLFMVNRSIKLLVESRLMC